MPKQAFKMTKSSALKHKKLGIIQQQTKKKTQEKST